MIDGYLPDIQAKFGPVLEVWEGHAADPEIRFEGASGGVLTALAIYCLEKLGWYGVLHTGADPDEPVRNRTRLSRTRAELLAACGSRYSPASVCDGLGLIADAPGPCVLIGKPVEAAAAHKAAQVWPAVRTNIGLAMSFFCAETPATLGTTALLDRFNVQPQELADLRYRGRGWPGGFAARRKGERTPSAEMSYRESWAFLQAYRPWSTHLWPDGSGELADISCGDPWYEEPDGHNPGFSLVVVRTERGREIVRGAIKAGYVKLKPAEAWKLEKSQAGLVKKKGAVWGRLLVLRLFGFPVPRYRGWGLFRCFRGIPWNEKARATLGTVRRILARGLWKPLELNVSTGERVKPPVLASELVGNKVEAQTK
jgi:coenzyme F420 hydrogenase subunit beta